MDRKLELLQRLFEAHRIAWVDRLTYGHMEVGWINGVNPRTAKALCDDGLAIEEPPPSAINNGNTYIRLPLPLPGDTDDHIEWMGKWVKDVVEQKGKRQQHV